MPAWSGRPSRRFFSFLQPRRRTIRKAAPRLLGLESLEQRLAPAAAPVQFFYAPLPADAMRDTLDTINAAVGNTLTSVTSLSATVDGTIIYYDQWEDGYETNIAIPTQLTTQIWGDNDATNGIAPGYVTDIVNAGNVITLRNDVPANPRNPAQIFFDGGDFIGASQTLAMTRAGWGVTPGTVLAGAVEVYDTRFNGTNFTAPVGTNIAAALQLFEYTEFYVMASQDNTNVQIDVNGDGTNDEFVTLNRGENYVSLAPVLAGGTVTADKPVQVQLATGDINDAYESRWFTLFDDARLASDYLSPVGTVDATHAVSIFVHNPNATPITVNFETQTTSGTFVVAAGGTFQHAVAGSTATHLFTTDGSRFAAIGANDVQATASGSQTFDWGFSLQPFSSLSPIAVVGWGPGSSNVPPGENYSPVWVTVERDTIVYVDFDGDPGTGPNVDPLGNQYNVSFNLTRLQSQRIFDPDNNQTGMRLYTLDGTLMSVAWGEDASVAVTGTPAMDLGTTVPAFPVPLFDKAVDFSPGGDANGDGLFNSGDTLRYTITIRNLGLYPVLNSVVGDTLPPEITYVLNSTVLDDGVTTSPVPDAGVNPFPLDEGGFTITNIVVGGTTRITFDVIVNPGLSAGTTSVTNTGTLSYGLVFNSDYVVAAIRAAIGDRVWNDLDADGVDDPGEPGVAGVTLDIYQDVNGDGLLDPGDTLLATVTTDASGAYAFIDLDEGKYVVDLTDTGGVLAGATQTFGGGPVAVTVGPGEVVGNIDFAFNFNLLPDAVDDGPFAATEDTPLITGDVLANDNLGDLPTTIIAFDAVSAQGGTVADNGNGTFTYTPPPNSNGTDTFTYTITDVDGESDTAIVTISIAAASDPPTATDNANLVAEDVQLTASGNVLTDDDGFGIDGDVDGDAVAVSAVNGAAGNVGNSVPGTFGSVTIAADGSYTYTLDNALPAVQALAAGETLTDTFDYTITDGNGGFASAQLVITITGTNDAPTTTGLPDQNNTDSDFVSINVSGAFSDFDATNVLTFGAIGLPPGLTIDPVTGVISGIIDHSASVGAPYSVTVTADDSNGGTVSATFTWNVINLAPVATDNTNSIAEDTVAPATGNVISDDNGFGIDGDPDGDPLAVSAVNGAGADVGNPVAGAFGNVTINSDGSYAYTLNNTLAAVQALAVGQSLTDSFTYTIDDGDSDTATAQLVITITGVNDAPTTIGLADRTNFDLDPVSIDVSGSFGDVDATDVLTFSATGLPPGLTIDPTTGVITGTLPVGASAGGPYTVTVTADDGNGGTVSAQFVWAVNPLSALGGFAYSDSNNDGVFAGLDTPLAGVTVTLTGTNDLGNAVSLQQTTLGDGSYQFVNLRPGTYAITETQPAGLLDGADTLGTAGGTAGNDQFTNITLGIGANGSGYNFAELAAARIAGRVFNDLDNSGAQNGTEPGIAGVTLTLTGTDDLGAVNRTVTTAANGDFAFLDLRPGTYTVTETQPVGYSQGTNTSPAGAVSGDTMSFTLVPGAVAAGNTFAERRPATIGGVVYFDIFRNGLRDPADPGIAGVTITLTGIDIGGNPVTRTTTTAADGSFLFTDLPPGTYQLTETLAAGLTPGANRVGTSGGVAQVLGVAQINLGATAQAQGYLFAQVQPPPLRGKRNFLGTSRAVLAFAPLGNLFAITPTVRRFTFSALSGLVQVP